MKCYKIYLTKSCEVAQCIALSYQDKLGKSGIIRISNGFVDNNNLIPKIYHEQNYFYCSIEYDEQEKQTYELIIA